MKTLALALLLLVAAHPAHAALQCQTAANGAFICQDYAQGTRTVCTTAANGTIICQ